MNDSIIFFIFQFDLVMLKQTAALLILLISFQAVLGAEKYDGGLGDDNGELVAKQEANQFLKRSLFHPFSTKNEEIKRETREVYEEKCESIVPGQR